MKKIAELRLLSLFPLSLYPSFRYARAPFNAAKTPGQGIVEYWGTYHLTENFGNSGWMVNVKVTFRKFQPKIEECVLR